MKIEALKDSPDHKAFFLSQANKRVEIKIISTAKAQGLIASTSAAQMSAGMVSFFCDSLSSNGLSIACSSLGFCKFSK